MNNSKSILVTGGAGFIGSHLCEFLLNDGHEIICLDNFNTLYNPVIKENNISAMVKNPSFTLFRNDIRKRDDLEDLFKKKTPWLVIHLAAMPGVRPSLEDPLLFFDVNLNGTIILLETMKKYSVNNMIFASSSSVYGNNSKIPFSESDTTDRQISPYAASKRAGELLCYTYHSLYKFNISCLRFFTVYGPRQRPDLAIHKFTDRILQNKPIQIFGDGHTSRDYTYITDIINGINNAIRHLDGYNIYNLGESETISLINLIEILEKTIGIKAIKQYFPAQPGDVERTCADINKARNELGYNPSFSFQEGIQKFVSWKLNYNIYDNVVHQPDQK